MDYKEKVIALLNSQELSKEQKEKLEEIFPELAESEDEKIRKALMQNLKERFGTKGNMGEGLDMPDVLAWFEKQAEQKPTKEHNVCDFCEDRYGCVNPCPMKLIEEQKPANNVEPKFKVGDWVVYKDAVWKVCNISLQNYYELLKINNEVGTRLIEDVDENAHLWTIQDAKDGDVLSWDDSKCIALFKNIYDEDTFNSYGLVGHCTGIFEPRQAYHSIEGAHPATKEQRDLLFQKMKEAGYEWDAEKKELKKIIAPIFHIGDRIRYKGHACDGVITEITDTDYICGNAKLPISTQDKLEIVGQKPAWSEEDENLYTRCLGVLGKCKCGITVTSVDDELSWLKSLRSHSRWKPSDEQMRALKIACDEHWEPDGLDPLYTLWEQLNKLK